MCRFTVSSIPDGDNRALKSVKARAAVEVGGNKDHMGVNPVVLLLLLLLFTQNNL